MTVPTSTSRSTYTGNAATTDFSTGFYFLAASEVVVKLTLLGGTEVVQTLGVHYTITMPLTVGAVGTVVMLTAPAAASTLVIERTVPYTQTTSFRTQGSFSPAVHEARFDEQTFIDQQLARRVSDLESAGAAGSVVAGNGLAFSGDTLHVGAGAGIQSNADTVEVLYGDAALGEITAVSNQAAGSGFLDKAARADHRHGISSAAPAAGSVAIGNAAGAGVATTVALSDHVHPVTAPAAPADVTKAAAAAGTSATFARADHKHDITTAIAIDLTDSTNAEGAATSLARSNHTHSHGARGGGTLHAVATAAANGFMPAAHFAALDGIKAARTHVRAWQSVLQAVANTTATTVIYDTEDYDAVGEYDNATGIFTAAAAGYYAVTAGVGLAAAAWAAGNTMAISLVRNAVSESGSVDVFDAIINRAALARFATAVLLAAGDTLKISLIHNQGGPVNTTATRSASWLTIDRLL